MSNPTRPILQIANLNGGYGQLPVLFDISLDINEGEIVALVGSNGAGKTTLLRAISRLINATGTLQLAGQDILAMRPEEVFARGLVQVPEGRQLFPRMSVEENLRIGANLRRDKPAVAASFDRVYTLFPILKDRRRQLAGNLSGGEQQMVALGRALMAAPRLLLVDEMSLGLAPVIVDQLLDVLRDIRAQGVTVLLVEQDVFAAFSVADRAYLMETGHIIRSGPVAELRDDPELQRAYLGVV